MVCDVKTFVAFEQHMVDATPHLGWDVEAFAAFEPTVDVTQHLRSGWGGVRCETACTMSHASENYTF